jgi:hypothetical protein
VLTHLRKKSRVDVQSISTELQLVLLHPTDRLRPESRRVVWQLLCAYQQWNVHRLYVYCRNWFFDLYRDWPDSKRDWAVKLIRDRYRPSWREA